jgi:hypothetical protein
MTMNQAATIGPLRAAAAPGRWRRRVGGWRRSPQQTQSIPKIGEESAHTWPF